MRKIDEIYKKVDEIIIKKHRIMGYIVDLARKELEYEGINPLERGLTIGCMKALGKTYSELEELINEGKLELYVDKAKIYNYGDIDVKTLEPEEKEDALRDQAIGIDIKDDIMTHIREGYEQMGFIFVEEEGEPSIYDGEKEEALRELEYESYRTEMDNLFNRINFRLDGFTSNMDLRETALIIQDLSEKDGYQQSEEILAKVQKKVEDKNNPDFNSLSEQKMYKLRQQIIYRKYEEFFKYYQSLYCGFLTEDMPEVDVVRRHNDMGALHILLGVSPSDINALHGFITNNYVDTLKDDIRAFIKGVKTPEKPKRKIDVIREGTLNFIENTISKSKEKGETFTRKLKDGVKKIKPVLFKSKKEEEKDNKIENSSKKGNADKSKIKVKSKKVKENDSNESKKRRPDDGGSRPGPKGGDSGMTR